MTDHPEPVAVTEALLPCPFCGGQAYCANPEPNVLWRVFCTNDCDVGNFLSNRTAAIAAWNRRTPPPTDAAPVGDTFGALTTALYDLDNTARLSDNPSAVPAARDRAKTLLDWMRRHGVTVVPLCADDDALGDAVVKVRATWKYLGGHKYTFETAALELISARQALKEVGDVE